MRHTLVDTSVLVEYLKRQQESRFVNIQPPSEWRYPLINPIIFSEVVYVAMGFLSGRAPRTIKGNPERLPDSLDTVFMILPDYAFMEITRESIAIAKRLIKEYAMFPNDALILATCIEHGFVLATLDEDFLEPAEGEGVRLVTGV